MRRRWIVGGIYPRAWTEAGHEDDPWMLSTECLARVPESAVEETTATIRATVRFLQPVERHVARQSPGGLELVDELTVGGERIVSREEAREREVRLAPVALQDHAAVQVAFDIPAAMHREWLPDGGGAVVRSWRAQSGTIRLSCRRMEDGVFRVGVQAWNTTRWEGTGRDEARLSSFASTHVVVEAEGCSFVSSNDPPPELQSQADALRNKGLWPVLVGERGSDSMMLAAPIILPDHPQIDPGGLAELLEEGEIDEMLTRHVLAPPEEESAEPLGSAPRVLGPQSPVAREPRSKPPMRGAFLDPSASLLDTILTGTPEPPEPETRPEGSASEVTAMDEELREGSRVRLRPRLSGDVFDMVLEGRTAVVEGVEEDEEGRPHVVVVVEEDPGLDAGETRQGGRRLFFSPDEVELLSGRGVGRTGALRGRRSSILVAGIGNVFLGDDGFGIEVVRRLRSRSLPSNVAVRDYGVRGLDLAYAFAEHEVVVLVDAVPRGGEPGTLYLIDATGEEEQAGVTTHGLDPASVIALARALGPMPEEVYVVGCEPAVVPDPDADETVGELSQPVRDAVDAAVDRVIGLVHDLLDLFEGRNGEVGRPERRAESAEVAHEEGGPVPEARA